MSDILSQIAFAKVSFLQFNIHLFMYIEILTRVLIENEKSWTLSLSQQMTGKRTDRLPLHRANTPDLNKCNIKSLQPLTQAVLSFDPGRVRAAIFSLATGSISNLPLHFHVHSTR